MLTDYENHKMTQAEVLPDVNRTTEKKTKKNDPHHYRDLAVRFLTDDDTSRPYRYHLGRVFRYDGTKYQEETELAMRVRKFLLREKIPHNNNVIGNVVPFVHSWTYCDPVFYPSMPFWFDDGNTEKPLKCDPVDVLSYRNGLVNVEDALKGVHIVVPHHRNWVSTSCLPYDYDPSATCPRWLAFLQDVLEGDEERIRLLQEWFGYCLLPDNSLQKLMVLKGVPRAGKGTTTTVLHALLGTSNVQGYSLTSLADKFGLGSLVGKLVAIVGEVNLQGCRDKYAILERLNMIVGRDPVEIEHKHDPIKRTMTLPVRFVVSCNDFPNFCDSSGALAQRLLLINFDKGVPPDRRDPNLARTLCEEVSGINNWALQGLFRLRTSGKFTSPKTMETAVNTIRRAASDVTGFLQDRLAVHKDLDTGNLPGVEIIDGDHWTTTELIESAYNSWCVDEGREPNTAWLVRNLKTILPKLERSKKSMSDGTRKWGYKGLKIKPPVG